MAKQYRHRNNTSPGALLQGCVKQRWHQILEQYSAVILLLRILTGSISCISATHDGDGDGLGDGEGLAAAAGDGEGLQNEIPGRPGHGHRLNSCWHAYASHKTCSGAMHCSCTIKLQQLQGTAKQTAAHTCFCCVLAVM